MVRTSFFNLQSDDAPLIISIQPLPAYPDRLAHRRHRRRSIHLARTGYPLSSRVIYTAKAKGRHTNPADALPSSRATASAAAAPAAAAAATAPPQTPPSVKPPALNLPLSFPLDAPWLDSAGRGTGGGSGNRGGRSRAYSSNSASAAGLPSPRYLQSTTVSQAKAVEPASKKRAGSFRVRRASLDGSETEGGGSGRWGGGVGWGSGGGMLESLGGLLGIGKTGGAGAEGTGRETRRGKAKKYSRGGESNTVMMDGLPIFCNGLWRFCCLPSRGRGRGLSGGGGRGGARYVAWPRLA